MVSNQRGPKRRDRADRDFDARVGGLLRDARKAKGLTLRELGAACGLSHAALSQYETGKAGVALRHLVRLAAALGVEPAELIPRDGEDAPGWLDDVASL